MNPIPQLGESGVAPLVLARADKLGLIELTAMPLSGTVTRTDRATLGIDRALAGNARSYPRPARAAGAHL